MTAARIAISLDPDLAKAVRKAVGKGSQSAYVADALRRKLQSDGLLAVVRDYETQYGAITENEIRAAENEQRAAIRAARRRGRRA